MISIRKILKFLILKITGIFPKPVHHCNGKAKCLCMEIISRDSIYMNWKKMWKEQAVNRGWIFSEILRKIQKCNIFQNNDYLIGVRYDMWITFEAISYYPIKTHNKLLFYR